MGIPTQSDPKSIIEIGWKTPGVDPTYVLMFNQDVEALASGVAIKEGSAVSVTPNDPHATIVAQELEIAKGVTGEPEFRLKSFAFPQFTFNLVTYLDRVNYFKVIMINVAPDQNGKIDKLHSA